MSLPEPFRGEVWDVDFDDFGMHPAVVVVSINPSNARLGHVAVIPVTGTRGPEQTYVPLTRYDESYAVITALQPVARSQLLARRGLLTRTEIDRRGPPDRYPPRAVMRHRGGWPVSDPLSR